MEPLDIKLVYTASKRDRRRARPAYAAAPTRASFIVFVGALSVVVAGALYYVTWWRADPKLRVLLLMRTPLPGVNLNDAASALVPAEKGTPATRSANPPTRPVVSTGEMEAQVTEAKFVVATVVAWVALITLAAAALALSGGALVGASGALSERVVRPVFTTVAVIAVGWGIYAFMSSGGLFVPDHLRLSVLAGLIVIVALGLFVGRGERALTYLAAILLILSAAGSGVALDVAVRHGLVKPDELPMALLPLGLLAFVAQSLWGWILLPLAPRLCRR